MRTRQFLSFLIVMAIWSFGLFFIYEQSSEEFLEMACEIMIHSGMNYNPLTLPEIEELEQYLRGKHR